MVTTPFHRLPLRMLRLLLVALVGVELVLGLSLYETTRPVASTPSIAVPTATPSTHHVASPTHKTKPLLPLVQNKPRTVVVGQKEEFSVRLPKLANQWVVYTMTYPNYPPVTKAMKSDATGFSKASFKITYKPTQFRAPVTISVYYGAVLEATTRFAVQLPSKAAAH